MNTVLQAEYPPVQISHTINEPFVVLQLTDLHIRACDLASSTNTSRSGTFKQLLHQALKEYPTCNLIILTGDLIDDMNMNIYDWVFSVMNKTGIPFICIAGNHDVTDEIGLIDTPFFQREFVPYDADKRLVSKHSLETEFWQILFIDSSVSGKVSGYIDEDTLEWLRVQLTHNNKPAVICLHHHTLPMNSEWLDNHITLNADEFWACLSPFKQVKITVCGHVHQESCTKYKHITAFTTPATSYQFKPNNNEFSLDQELKPGYRWLYLYKNGSFTSEVKRLQT